MKSGKKPTISQRKAMAWAGVKNTDNWLVVKNLPEKMVLVHRTTGHLKEVPNAV